jgi:hypothetical protein
LKTLSLSLLVDPSTFDNLDLFNEVLQSISISPEQQSFASHSESSPISPICSSLAFDDGNITDATEHEEEVSATWLNPVADEDDSVTHATVPETISQLIAEAKKYKSFSSLMHLHAVKRFIELHAFFSCSPKIKNPTMHASYAVTTSVGKGPYFAKKICTLHQYIHHFKTLPWLTQENTTHTNLY